jgi:taurine dioxygenase
MRRSTVRPGSPWYEHPVIARHPRTGVEIVMAGAMHTDSIVGVPAAESDALLREIFAILYDPANVLRHAWSVGDLVLWDNIALQHGRRDIPLDEPRTLQRVVLGDYTPSELVPHLAELLAAR